MGVEQDCTTESIYDAVLVANVSVPFAHQIVAVLTAARSLPSRNPNDRQW